MYFFIRFIKHYFAASNQHGVHSPFVYAFVTKCLYKKPKFFHGKSENLLMNSIAYFSPSTLKLASIDSSIATLIEKEFNLKSTEKHPFDLIYMNTIEKNVLTNHKDKIHNDSMMLLNNIHRNKKMSEIWNSVKNDEKVTVSIDMLYCGAIFFRKEQAKEHFKIRI